MIEAERLLTQYGLSKTKVRMDLLTAFLQSKRPLSIFDFKEIKGLSQASESSIYRNLSRFEELELIRAIPSSNDFQSYEMLPRGKHHHHIVCRECKKVQCLSVCQIERELKSMAKSVGFSLDTHSLELSGTCNECRG